jgi:hypothetical protein
MFFWISCVPRVLVKTLEGVGEQASADESKLDLEVQYNLSGLAMAVLQLIGILVGMSQVKLGGPAHNSPRCCYLFMDGSNDVFTIFLYENLQRFFSHFLTPHVNLSTRHITSIKRPTKGALHLLKNLTFCTQSLCFLIAIFVLFHEIFLC